MLAEELKSLFKQDYVSEETIRAMFTRRGLEFEFKSYFFGNVAGFLIEGMGSKAFIPTRNISFMNRKFGRLTTIQERALAKKIPLPLFIGEGEFSAQLHKLSTLDDGATNEWLVRIFTPAVASIYVLRYFEKSQALAPFLKIIYESIEAYFMEMDHVAIMSLLPVIEGGLRNVQEIVLGYSDSNVRSEEFAKRIGDLIIRHGERQAAGVDIYPGSSGNNDVRFDFFTHVNPQCDVINTFRIFFEKVLYRRSDGAEDGFNRHLILHLLKNDFASPSNYVRVFLLLSHIAFCERLDNASIPMLWPGSDEETVCIAEYFGELSKKVGTPRSLMWCPGTPFPKKRPSKNA